MIHNMSLTPRHAGSPLVRKANTPPRRSPTLSRRELRQLIADMVD